MRYKRLPQTAIDSGGTGLEIIPVLLQFGAFSDKETAKQRVRAGDISINNAKVKDVKHILLPGMHLIEKNRQALVKITIL